jgi:hypothetical protein
MLLHAIFHIKFKAWDNGSAPAVTDTTARSYSKMHSSYISDFGEYLYA